MTANEAQIEGTGEKVNLFDYHVKADTILFQYTTPDGRDEVVKFPLAGFCENYLLLLIYFNSCSRYYQLFLMAIGQQPAERREQTQGNGGHSRNQ